MTYRLFDEFAIRYDYHTPPAHYQHDHEFVLDLARGQEPPCRLLDLGCGTGVLIEKARREGIEATGIDAAPGMVDVASTRLGPGVVRLGRMQELDMTDAVDIVTALSWTLNYCESEPDLTATLRRCRRALRPGGVLLAQVAHAPNATGELFEDRESGPAGEHGDVRFLYRFTSVSEAPAILQADYVYTCKSRNELVFESHVLRVADVHTVVRLMETEGFDNITVFDSWRREPLGSSVSPFILAHRVGS